MWIIIAEMYFLSIACAYVNQGGCRMQLHHYNLISRLKHSTFAMTQVHYSKFKIHHEGSLWHFK